MADPKAPDLFQRLVTFMRESDEWGTPADVLRSAEDAGLAIVSEAERKVLEACDDNRKAPESVMRAVCETSVALADAIDGGGPVPPKLLEDWLDAMAAQHRSEPRRWRGDVMPTSHCSCGSPMPDLHSSGCAAPLIEQLRAQLAAAPSVESYLWAVRDLLSMTKRAEAAEAAEAQLAAANERIRREPLETK
jgi:hypothetical protein